MIKFSCLCRHNFAFEDDMVGREIQCPSCGRLVTIPTIDELKQMTAEGTYAVDLTPIPKEEGRLKAMHRIFSNSTVDIDGVEKDLRQSREDIEKAGITPLDLVGEIDGKPIPPKYDPESGELVREIEVRHDPNLPLDPSKLPLAQTTISYARTDLQMDMGAHTPLIALLTPINLVVMFFILLAHVCLTLIAIPMLLRVWFAVPVFFLLFGGIFSHYANVIEEIGVEGRDELPRPLRHVSFLEDFWNPFFRELIAFIYCYLPAILAYVFAPAHFQLPLLIGLGGLGTIFFPAALLTTTTSGNLENLRPDRVLGIIATIGAHYLLAIVLFVPGIVMSITGVGCVAMNFLTIFGAQLGLKANGFIAYGLLLSGIYLMHAFSWHLGLMYRAHQDRFPWVLQRHVHLTPQEMMAMRTARQAAARHKTELRKIDNETARRLNF